MYSTPDSTVPFFVEGIKAGTRVPCDKRPARLPLRRASPSAIDGVDRLRDDANAGELAELAGPSAEPDQAAGAAHAGPAPIHWREGNEFEAISHIETGLTSRHPSQRAQLPQQRY
jgi:hypothetical protein